MPSPCVSLAPSLQQIHLFQRSLLALHKSFDAVSSVSLHVISPRHRFCIMASPCLFALSLRADSSHTTSLRPLFSPALRASLHAGSSHHLFLPSLCTVSSRALLTSSPHSISSRYLTSSRHLVTPSPHATSSCRLSLRRRATQPLHAASSCCLVAPSFCAIISLLLAAPPWHDRLDQHTARLLGGKSSLS